MDVEAKTNHIDRNLIAGKAIRLTEHKKKTFASCGLEFRTHLCLHMRL